MARIADTPTIGARGAVIGRPRKQPPEDAAKQIYDLAAKGCCSLRRLAPALRISINLLRLWLEEYEDLRESFKFGCEANAQELVEILMNDARDREKPNVNAMYLLKVLHGFREGEPPDTGARINVTFNVPGALSREDYLKNLRTVSDDGNRELEADAIPAARRIDSRGT